MLEGVEQQDGAKDDPQHRQGDQYALHGGGQDAVKAHVPGEQRDQCRHDENQRHRLFG
ncbi:hypothetical protein D3C71_2123810 [compost metagenome]